MTIQNTNTVPPQSSSQIPETEMPASLPFVARNLPVRISLRDDFRFRSEPATLPRRADADDFFVGREPELNEFVGRLCRSHSGSFLVTGYRGVGKTSFVNQAIKLLKARKEDATVLDIYLPLAQPVAPDKLMYELIRALYYQLDEREILPWLDRQTQTYLRAAFERTSMTLSQQEARGKELNVGSTDLSASPIPKVSVSAKETKQTSVKQDYLPYDAHSAEYDFRRIVTKLDHNGYFNPKPWYARAWHLLLERLVRRPYPRLPLKLVVVFDELDKLTDATVDNGQTYVQRILSTLKTLFTESGASFIFVAGKDMYDHSQRDLEQGDSIYESIFAYHQHLSPMWGEAASFYKQELKQDSLNEPQQTLLNDLEKYLNFSGRGLPRRIIRAFEKDVRSDSAKGNCWLEWDVSYRQLLSFYAGLQDSLQNQERVLLDFYRATLDFNEQERDRQRLTCYYLLDLILRIGWGFFTVEEILRFSENINARILIDSSSLRGLAQRLLDVLVEQDYLEKRRFAPTLLLCQQAAPPASQIHYRLSRHHVFHLTSLRRRAPVTDDIVNELERLSQVVGEHYRPYQKINDNGLFTFYWATDVQSGRMVLLKLFAPTPNLQAAVAQYMNVEETILRFFSHAALPRLYAEQHYPPHALLAFDLASGQFLGDILQEKGKMPVPVAIKLITRIADLLVRFAHQGICRLDIKPESVFVDPDGQVYLVDLGLAYYPHLLQRGVDHLVDAGTRLYMDPFRKDNQPDARSDIYSLGILLYQALTGSAHPPSIDHLPNFLSGHADLRVILGRCLAVDPDKRYQTFSDLLLDAHKVQAEVDSLANWLKRSSVGQKIETQPIISAKVKDESQTIANIDNTLFVHEASLVNSNEGVIYPLGFVQEIITIGRSNENDIVLMGDRSVSRYHARLRRVGSQWSIEPCVYAVATLLVNGIKIKNVTKLRHGMRIQLGDVILHYLEPASVLPQQAVYESGSMFVDQRNEKPVIIPRGASEPNLSMSLTNDGQSRQFTQPVTAVYTRTKPVDVYGMTSKRVESAVVPTIIYHIRQKDRTGWQQIGTLGGAGGILGRTDWETNQFVLTNKVGKIDRLETVSSPHALVEVWDNDGTKVINLRDLNSSHKTLLNNAAISAGRQLLQHGDIVRFGQADEYEVDLRSGYLTNLSGGANIPLPLSGNATLITRLWVRSLRLTNNAQLSDPHLLLHPTGGRPLSIVLRDLNSTNGAIIFNGETKRLHELENKQFVSNNQIEIQLGQLRYQIQVSSQDKPPQVGNYEVVKQFNRSGICHVYLVKDPQTDEYFVAKVPNLKQYENADIRQNAIIAFSNESQLLRESDSEHLVRHIDANPPDEQDNPYLIIQYVPPAADLEIVQEKMKQAGERMPLKQIRKIIQSLIAALAHLHEQGWAHCDVKPSNVLLSDDGRVYLIDLGSATRFGEKANFITDYYSAPEARDGHAIYPMSDIYSVGVILFELLTATDASKLNLGTLPRLSSAPRTSAVDVLNAPYTLGNLDDLFQQAPAFAQGFKHIIAKCLPNSPDERYRDMGELLEALDDAYNMEPIAHELEQDGPGLDSLVNRFASQPI